VVLTLSKNIQEGYIVNHVEFYIQNH
jgi:hypothetical protein